MSKPIRSPLRAAFAVAALAFAAAAVAQVSTSPSATPVPEARQNLAFDEPGYGRYWSAMDTNADGRVSRDEYIAFHGSRWDRSDTRRQGYYNRQELRTLYFEREMSKTDGHPKGSPINPTTTK